jgi:hypothetical protein
MLAAAALTVALPANALGTTGYNTPSPSYVVTSGNVAGVIFKPLINSSEMAFGDIFEGIPDGIGVVPGRKHGHGDHGDDKRGWVDIYVTHEQSRVPFGGKADFSDSSVTRVRVDLKTMSITDMEVALPSSAGFIRFCSAFMVGPDQGFKHYTFLVNEESNDPLVVPAGAVYPADPFYAPNPWRQAGYSVHLDTETGAFDVLAGAGRHNHENQVVVPGWEQGIVSLSGDDTFITPSTPARPNLSQLYMFKSKSSKSFLKDEGTLWAFRVTGTGSPGPFNKTDPFNNANDYLEIQAGDTWKGEFIPVPASVARGTAPGVLPQDALEDWSNANNVFQFVRVEDIAYDPDKPRTVYFADTGTSRLFEDPAIGRLIRLGSSDPRVPQSSASNGRVFKMVLNKHDPTKVDSFSILADSADVGFINPDNIAVGHKSIMVQEDPPGGARVWKYSLADATWTHVATAVQPIAETSGIVDVSEWFGRGWWALDVQSHIDLPGFVTGQTYTGPGPANGTSYTARREDGQLLLMYVPGS